MSDFLESLAQSGLLDDKTRERMAELRQSRMAHKLGIDDETIKRMKELIGKLHPMARKAVVDELQVLSNLISYLPPEEVNLFFEIMTIDMDIHKKAIAKKKAEEEQGAKNQADNTIKPKEDMTPVV